MTVISKHDPSEVERAADEYAAERSRWLARNPKRRPEFRFCRACGTNIATYSETDFCERHEDTMQAFTIEIEVADKDQAKLWTKLGELGQFGRIRSVETTDKGPDDPAEIEAAEKAAQPARRRGRPPKNPQANGAAPEPAKPEGASEKTQAEIPGA